MWYKKDPHTVVDSQLGDSLSGSSTDTIRSGYVSIYTSNCGQSFLPGRRTGHLNIYNINKVAILVTTSIIAVIMLVILLLSICTFVATPCYMKRHTSSEGA